MIQGLFHSQWLLEVLRSSCKNKNLDGPSGLRRIRRPDPETPRLQVLLLVSESALCTSTLGLQYLTCGYLYLWERFQDFSGQRRYHLHTQSPEMTDIISTVVVLLMAAWTHGRFTQGSQRLHKHKDPAFCFQGPRNRDSRIHGLLDPHIYVVRGPVAG